MSDSYPPVDMYDLVDQTVVWSPERVSVSSNGRFFECPNRCNAVTDTLSLCADLALNSWDTRTSKHDDVIQVISTSVFALAVLNGKPLLASASASAAHSDRNRRTCCFADGRVASGSAEGLVEIWPVASLPNPTPLTVQSAAAIPLQNGGAVGSGSMSGGPGGAAMNAGVSGAGGPGTGSISGGPGGASAQSAAAGSAPNGSIDKLGGSQANLQPLQGVGRASVAAPVQPRSQPQLAFKGHRAAVWALQTLPGTTLFALRIKSLHQTLGSRTDIRLCFG